MKAPLPGNEADRLRALLELKVLDTGDEPAFGDLVRLAAHVCQTPSAAITFVDESRQWFQSSCGLPFTQTHRDLAIGAHAILSPDVLVVPDATRDPRCADNPLVTGPPHIRFYAGVPLILDGFGLGTIEVMDSRPRDPSAEQLDALRALSRQVMTHLALRRSVANTGQRVAQAESSLQLATEHHRAIVDSALDAIVTMNAQGRVTEFNPAAERMFGYRRSETIGRLMGDLIVPPEDRERHAQGLARFLRTGEAVILGRHIEIVAMRHDGTQFSVELSIQRIGNADPPTFTGFIRDVTERRQLEAQLRQSQKMEAIGQLAGGVAHDFNNLLTVIQGHASLLLIDGDQGDSARDSILQIADAAERAAGLTRQLLAFSRKQVLQSTDLDLNVTVANMMRLLQRILGEPIALQVELSAAPSYVRADASMMEQVIMNLAVNARDAMPQGGRLTLRTSIELIDADYVRQIHYARTGRFVRLSVSDTGSGITAADLPHIFEPFYTTKDVQRGTGLGLATVYGIVKQHHGWVNVQSAVAEGATFDVYLPAVPVPTALEIVPEHEAPPKGGGETLLVVEDEVSVGRLVRLLLERHGYTVLEAGDGPGALAVWQQHRGRIDLVLTDMVMPGGLSGLELASQLLEEHPRVRVIVSSGYSPELLETDTSRIDRVRFLPKPYSAHQLLTMVREGLDAR